MYRLVFLSLVFILVLGGCSPPTTNFNGREVTLDSLPMEAERAIAAIERDARKAADAEAFKIRQQEIEFRRAVSLLNTRTQTEIEDLTFQFQATVDAANHAISTIKADVDAAVQGLHDSAELARQNLEQQWEQRSAGLGIASKVLAATPLAPYAGLIEFALPAVLGIGGTAYAAHRSGKAKDAAWDEADEKANTRHEKEKEIRDREFAEAQSQLLSLMLSATGLRFPVSPPGSSSDGSGKSSGVPTP